MNKKKIVKILLGIVGIFFLTIIVSVTAQATGLIDETLNSSNNYSKYPIENYALDYFVDSSWDWLPWNWGDGIGKSVMYGIYAITDLIWLIGVYLSSATGYLVGEAYSLDFISDTTEAIGRNIQTLAGINESGFMSTGFYPGLLLLLILIMGIYVTYTGLIKREVTKATGALISFLTIFVLSASFIAYSTSYISRINDFSADISKAALDVGSKMTMPNSNTQGKSSVDAIRDSLFEIQVKQPWMILQYGDSDIEKVGVERVEELESTSPFANKGKDRTEIIKEEVNDRENDNMTITKTISRLGVATFIFIFNLFISVFIFILTGIMIFSQILFIIFAVFLPISFLLSMIPSFNHLMKQTIMRLFNVIMMRAGITLVLTISFSLSAMVYSLTATQPFFVVAFMQIVVFAGIYFKLNDLMGMMALSSSDSQNTTNRVMRRPKQTASRAIRKIVVGGLALKGFDSTRKERNNKKESKRTDPTKNSEQKDKQATKNREQPNKKSLPDNRKQKFEEKNMERKGKNVGKHSSTTQQLEDKAKLEAARKFKQSKFRGNKQNLSGEEKDESKKTQESKRRNAPTRSLEKPKRKPVNQRASQQNIVPNSQSDIRENQQDKTQLKNQNRRYGKKSSEKIPPLNQTNRLAKTNEMKPLVKGQAIKRESTITQKTRKTTNKTISKSKNNSINGKGAKRR
ncbi:CD3337/EF1877 family mobilome membrane protein [Enterococcus sp.]|uniref:CD3337/EF1877 family mobilome membrane protein n=1 Tax=Enterococcus sp. TaxID=35783 RepID=UPI002911A033|nr:FUSC family protein [Enterococcus sp.]MDU5335729.1 FUSC family protein [Enterococcus sp.]